MLTALAEETADVAYIQQLVICMRLVDDQLTTQEERRNFILFRTQCRYPSEVLGEFLDSKITGEMC